MKELARTDPWRTYWSADKNNIFSQSILNLTDEQRKGASLFADACRIYLPIEDGSPAKSLRDKASAHVDKRMTPKQVRKLLDSAPLSAYAGWIHKAVLLLLELTSMNAYKWSTEGPTDDSFRLMTNEPFGVLFRKSGDVLQIVEVEISRSPRLDVQLVCRDLVRDTQRMFSGAQVRLVWKDNDGPRFQFPGEKERGSHPT